VSTQTLNYANPKHVHRPSPYSMLAVLALCLPLLYIVSLLTVPFMLKGPANDAFRLTMIIAPAFSTILGIIAVRRTERSTSLRGEAIAQFGLMLSILELVPTLVLSVFVGLAFWISR